MPSLERKWWFAGPVAALAVFLALRLLAAADISIASPTMSQFIVFLLCVLGIARVIHFVAGFAVLAIRRRAVHHEL